jgi:hypothetical protein
MIDATACGRLGRVERKARISIVQCIPQAMGLFKQKGGGDRIIRAADHQGCVLAYLVVCIHRLISRPLAGIV